jgi:hypothetical protein
MSVAPFPPKFHGFPASLAVGNSFGGDFPDSLTDVAIYRLVAD